MRLRLDLLHVQVNVVRALRLLLLLSSPPLLLIASLSQAQSNVIPATTNYQINYQPHNTRFQPVHTVLVRGDHRAQQVDSLPLVLPYDDYVPNPSQDIGRSYVIDNKRFIEAFSMRCFSSTVLEDPSTIEPQFVIIRPKSEVRVNATASLAEIRRTGFEPQKQTKVLVHGFTQSYPNTTWLRKVRALFELHGHLQHYNLIIMDWGVASHGSYAQVASKVGGMGSFLANFLLKLIDLGADRASIHIIGHSLGSHVAGFAGKRLRPRIGRITALDPAGPCFGKFISNSKTDRLNADDAYQVDVFHYDDGFLGLHEQLGQFDIYVNGGSNQPGCTDNAVSMVQALFTIVFRRNRPLSDSHTRSTEVASSHLSYNGCQEVAFECRDWAAFISGECGRCNDSNSQCFFMGFPFQYTTDQMDTSLVLRSSFPAKKLYIATSGKEPFCLNHYQIVVKLEPSPELVNLIKRNRWRVHLELFNDQNECLNVTMTNQMAPNAFSYLFLTEHAPARVRFGFVQVRSHSDNSIAPFNQLSRPSSGPILRVNRIEINFMSNFNPNIRRMLSSVLCPTLANTLLQQVDPTRDPNRDHWIAFDECL